MASDGAKIAWGIVAAAVIIVGGVIGYIEFTKWQIGRAAQTLGAELNAAAAKMEADRIKRQQAEASARHKAQQSRWLRRPERCVGGKVMIPEPSGKAGWIMQYERGQVVLCKDGKPPYRLKPRPLADQ